MPSPKGVDRSGNISDADRRKKKKRPNPPPAVELPKFGRPAIYKPEFAELVRRLRLLNHTREEMAEFFNISPKTIDEWRVSHEDFSLSYDAGGTRADLQLAATFHEVANGYTRIEKEVVKRKISRDEEIIEIIDVERYHPPHPYSTALLLANRQPGRFSLKPGERPATEDGKENVVIKGGLPDD